MQALPSCPGCPVCGDPRVNPHTLAVRWAWDETARAAVTRFVPGPHHAGYESRMHGGLLTALLDEAMAWACAVAKRSYCVTGELQVRFLAPAEVGGELCVSGRADGHTWGPYVRASGEVRAADGSVVATATAVFSALPRGESEILRRGLLLAPGDLDVLAGDVADA